MKKFLLSLVAALVAVACLSAVSFAATGSWNKWWLFVKKGVAIGVNSGTARLTVKGDGTNDIASFLNSSGTEVLEIGSAGALAPKNGLSVTGAITCSTTGTFSGEVTINDNLVIDNDAVSDIVVTVDGTSGQVSDLQAWRSYDGTEVADVSAAGLIGAKNGLAIAGDITIDGTAGLDAASIVIDGNTLTFAEGLLTACSGAGCP